MKIHKIDITTQQFKSSAIAHGVNCQRVMGSGLAKALSDRWPKVKEKYMLVNKKDMYLGRVQSVVISPDLTIFNCWTQEFYGLDERVYASPLAIERCLTQVQATMKQNNIKHLYIPKIGCGLGGLNWNTVRPIIERLNVKYTVFEKP